MLVANLGSRLYGHVSVMGSHADPFTFERKLLRKCLAKIASLHNNFDFTRNLVIAHNEHVLGIEILV